MRTIILGVILGIMLVFANTQISGSTLGKLVVTVKAEKTPISAKQFPVIVGTVTNEASKPIDNVKVKITFAKEVITTSTDSNGNFRYESQIPSSTGQFMINVVATKDGYGTGYASSTYFVNVPPPVTFSKGTKGAPMSTGNYTVYLGKVTEWNLETTCFVAFGEEYRRFLKTCDLYEMAPDDFKKPTKMISVLTVIKYNGEYKLFPVNVYYDTYKHKIDDARIQYLYNIWNNNTVSN